MDVEEKTIKEQDAEKNIIKNLKSQLEVSLQHNWERYEQSVTSLLNVYLHLYLKIPHCLIVFIIGELTRVMEPYQSD